MKKVYFTSLVLGAMLVSANAFAVDSTGCGLASGCDPEGRVTGGTQKMVLAFIENNMEQYALDASRGSGETIDTLAGILNMDKSVLGAKSQQNFAVLFPNENVQAVDVTLSLFEILKA